MRYAIEKLAHFNCDNPDCGRWFTIGDAPVNRAYYCPWCGEAQGLKELEDESVDDDKPE